MSKYTTEVRFICEASCGYDMSQGYGKVSDLAHYPDADGPVYRSTVDNNVWSPADYPAGWEVVE